jgi:hypothetical protein
MVSSSELTRIIVCKYLVIGCPPLSVFEISFGAILSWSRHPNRLQARMCTARARSPVEIGAHIVPRQVQHLAPDPRNAHRAAVREQYSSICASVSADPRASLPCALHAAVIRRTQRSVAVDDWRLLR